MFNAAEHGGSYHYGIFIGWRPF